MLSKILKEKIEEYYHRAKDSNPLFENARLGKITGKEIGPYLVNILYLIKHTPIYLKYAKYKAEERGLQSLAGFFGAKLHEESGHDKWVESDLSHLKKVFHSPVPNDIHPHMARLVDYLKEVIERDPTLYVGYILLAEYFTVLLGPQWINDLEKKCGIPRSMMSVIGNHMELDKEHVLEDLRQIDGFLGKGQDPGPFIEVVLKAIHLHEMFCSRIGTVDERAA